MRPEGQAGQGSIVGFMAAFTLEVSLLCYQEFSQSLMRVFWPVARQVSTHSGGSLINTAVVSI
jgi:hypothetical protein